MAVVAFNCNKIKHTYWPFTFKDTEDENGKVAGRKIIVRMPSKGTFEKIQEFQEIADMGEDEIRVAGVIGSMHELIAEVLNNNLENPNPKKPKKPFREDSMALMVAGAYPFSVRWDFQPAEASLSTAGSLSAVALSVAAGSLSAAALSSIAASLPAAVLALPTSARFSSHAAKVLISRRYFFTVS